MAWYVMLQLSLEMVIIISRSKRERELEESKIAATVFEKHS
jgi:hypothetical protein